MNDERIREFLRDSLILWRVEGRVEPGEPPVVAVIRAGESVLRIERKAEGPFRWLVHADRARPSASIAGVLNAVRSALGVERGEPIRVVASAVRPEPVEGRTPS